MAESAPPLVYWIRRRRFELAAHWMTVKEIIRERTAKFFSQG